MDDSEKTELPAAPAQREYLIIEVEPEALHRARARCAMNDEASLEALMADVVRVYSRGLMLFTQGQL